TAMGDLQSQETSNPCSISQYAAIAAINGPQACVDEMLEQFTKRRQYVFERIEGIPGLSCAEMAGAFYAFINIREHLGRDYGSARVDNSSQWCLELLAQRGVATVMGSAFGAEGYARISFATSIETLKAAFDEIAAFVK
ncbi:MAG: aminotransferase class I/II-fold pyridoxal phosphate-dependent enzyme, partial [Patescibacteria group bacterium]|nr:aminotransferase class I/II-fold pyridoxal phosphate-dependent enzyme [Patescibacteria group bacterium]